MILIVFSGLLVLPILERKIIPDISFDIIEVKVVFPGAGPTQIEQSVTRRIEQALVGLDQILDVKSQVRKNISITGIEISHDASLNEMINKIQARVNAIALPKEIRRPVVREVIVTESVISLAVSGEMDLAGLNNIAQYIASGLRDLPYVSRAFVEDGAERNFVVEASKNNLQRYQVSFSELTQKLKSASADISGAAFKSLSGDISIIGDSSIDGIASIEQLPIRSQTDGSRITVMDVAAVKDSYTVNDRSRYFDGKNVVFIAINRASHEDVIKLSNQVEEFVANIGPSLPSNVSVTIANNITKEVSGRIELLINNALGGFFLVLLILLLFMSFRLSFWTSLGIPISFLGAFFVLYLWGGSLNMVSMFAFILVLGVVVDDAIIVGESVYSQHQKNNYGIQGAIKGTLEVYRPVFFAIATTMVAFAPMLFMPGEEGRLALVIPIVVISVLAFSLFESLFILPAHLSTIKGKSQRSYVALEKYQKFFSNSLNHIIENFYSPFLEKMLHWRYTCLSVFLALFLVCLSIIGLRWVNVDIISKVESDLLTAQVQMISDTPLEETRAVVRRLEQAGFQLKKEVNESLGFEQIKHIVSGLDNKSDLKGSVSLYLDPDQKREVSSQELGERLREILGDVPNLRSLKMKTSLISTGAEIDLELSHSDLSILEEASKNLKSRISGYDGVLYSWDTLSQGKREVGFSLKPAAGDLGISNEQIATQIRQAFHGENFHVLDEQGSRIPLKIHYAEEHRNSLWSLENLPITLKDRTTIPLYAVADLEYREGPAIINLHNSKRSVRVIAKLDQSVSSAYIMKSLREDFLDDLDSHYIGLDWKVSGGQKRGLEALDYLIFAYPLSLFVMYLFMAILFASYTQPLMIMAAIPFGIVGALIGHLFLGIGLTLWSLVGIVAVSGVVVNDNLVLVDRINQSRKQGVSLLTAIREAGAARFRPIILTSLTTFLGLTPLMLESSVQAQFLIPMAASLAFGVVFATTISLILVPVFYAIFHDFRHIFKVRYSGLESSTPSHEP